MPDFLTTLAQRTLKTVPVIQPMIAPLYAASFTEAAAPMEQEIWTEPAHTLKQAKSDTTPHKPRNSRATVPPTAAAHTEEVPLNRVEPTPDVRHDDREFGTSEGESAAQKPTPEKFDASHNDRGFGTSEGENAAQKPTPEKFDTSHNDRGFGTSEGENAAKVGVRGGGERGGGLRLTLAESIESTEITVITGTGSIPSEGKPKAPTPLPASPYPYFDERLSFPSAKNSISGSPDAQPGEPLVQESLEANTLNDTYPKDYRNSDANMTSKEKDVEGTNSLSEQFELVQRTGMAIPPVLRSPETSEQHGIINLTPTPDISLPGNGVHRQTGIINLTPTPDISLPGNEVHRQHGIINLTPTPDISLPGNGNGVLNNNVASLLDVSSDGRRLNDDPTLFSTGIAPFHPPQSTNTSGPQGFDAASDGPVRSQTPPTPVVHITIGRIDVRAITTQTPETRRSAGKTRSSLSLDDYMNKQSKGER